MSRRPLRRCLSVTFTTVVVAACLLPSLFGETSAIQVSINRQAIVTNGQTQSKVDTALKQTGIQTDGMFIVNSSLEMRFKDTGTQLKARDVIKSTLDEGYTAAFDLLADSPERTARIKAGPMFLGLDLRGSVHFTVQMGMKAVIQKTFERYSGGTCRELRRKKIHTGTVRRAENGLIVPLQSAIDIQRALPQLQELFPGTTLLPNGNNIALTLPEKVINKIRPDVVKQSISTLRDRMDELSVAEPAIQQPGLNRTVVQLPDVQDIAKTRGIIDRTATLGVRMVEDDLIKLQGALDGNIPIGYELLSSGGDCPKTVLVSEQVELTGDNINNVQPSFDQMGALAVSLSLDNASGSIFGELTSANAGKHIAMVLTDQGKSKIVTAPVICAVITNGRVETSGSMTTTETNDTSLLLRAGSLAAPMWIVKERAVGPSLGKRNTEKGFHSTLWDSAAVTTFTVIYYHLMGFFSTIALSTSILFLVGILSVMQAVPILPGITTLALALGMAIDFNALTNKRIREGLHASVASQQAINPGFQRTWATIADSNLTSLTAGTVLLVFDSDPVRGFAAVHYIGILTSIYPSVAILHILVNLWYGCRRRLQNISIGSVWRPKAEMAEGKE